MYVWHEHESLLFRLSFVCSSFSCSLLDWLLLLLLWLLLLLILNGGLCDGEIVVDHVGLDRSLLAREMDQEIPGDVVRDFPLPFPVEWVQTIRIECALRKHRYV